MTSALGNLVVLLAIGIAAGLLFNRYGETWLSRQFTTQQTDITAALVGIAGAFIGWHVAVILGLGVPFILFIVAVIGAVGTLWLWRGR